MLQGDHLGTYLKQTPGSNMHSQTQRNIIHCLNNQGEPFYLRHKNIRYLENLTCKTWSKLHHVLRTDAARLDVGRVWLFSPNVSMLLTKGIHRRLQMCSAIDFNVMRLSGPRNKDAEVKH